MMYQLECPNCGQLHQFSEESQRPTACRCLYPLDSVPIQKEVAAQVEEETKSVGKIEKVVLTYQKTGEKIEIKNVTEVILGRENVGQEVLSKVPQISRRHCLLKIQDQQVLVTDLDSTHGTYIGVERIDCKVHPDQPLKNNELLFLGREPLLVNFIYAVEVKPKKVIYRCRSCGFETENFDKNQKICPQCNEYDSIEQVEL